MLRTAAYRAQSQPAGLVRALGRTWGAVDVVDPDEVALSGDRWLDDVGVVVARGRSIALYAALATAETDGIPTCNTRAAIRGVHDKADAAATLVAAGVPTPPTWLGTTAALTAVVPASHYPVILKPVFGSNGLGLLLVNSLAGELAEVEWPDSVALAQRWVPAGGIDLKLYVIGDQVWAVRKPSPLSFSDQAAEPVELTPPMRRIAARCRALFGLQLFGVDCVDSPAGPVVIEVNDFPNYTAVDGADDALARFVVRMVETRR